MKYMVAVDLIDMAAGSPVTVPFFADTSERADLLRDMLRTCRDANDGHVRQYTQQKRDHLSVRNVLEPARVEA